MEQIYTPKQDYKVLVRCFTYNQSHYIEDALDGFAMQKTDFPFVCLVMDDCSTDGEQEVIKAWMNENCEMPKAKYIDLELSSVILVRHKTNPTCSFAFYLLKQNLYKEKEYKMSLVKPWREHCKYEAMCEGDDYWIDPQKIQTQVNYLERHQETQLIGSNGIILHIGETTKVTLFNNHIVTRDVQYSELCTKWIFPTASLLYRISVLNDYPEWTKQMCYGDQVLIMIAAGKGNIATIGKPTCIYRKGVGVTTQTDKQSLYMHEQHLFLYANLLKDSDEAHKQDLLKRIEVENNYISYYKLYNKSKILAFVLFPKISLPDTLYRLYRKVRTSISRIYQ